MSTQGNALNLSAANPLDPELGGTGMSTNTPIDTLVQKNSFNFAATAGSADAYTVTLSPVPAAYTDGMPISFLASFSNTTDSPTINVNGLGPKTIVTSAGVLSVADITLNNVYYGIYNSANDNVTLLNPTYTFALAALIQDNFYTSADDTGIANAYVADIVPGYNAVIPSSGAFYWIKILHSNTTASTLDLNGDGPKNIVNLNAAALTGGELVAGNWAQVVWDGTNYVLQNQADTTLGGIVTLDGDSGTASGATVSILSSGISGHLCGSSVSFVGNNASAIVLGVTDGANNTLIGYLCGSITPGGGNTGLGYYALGALNSNNNNTAVGYLSLTLATGDGNSAFGENSLPNLLTGTYNVAIGSDAGSNYAGAESNNIMLASAGVLGESNVLRIGEATGTGLKELSTAYIYGINGNTVSNQQFVTINSSTSQLGTVAASSAGFVLTAPTGPQTITTYGLTLPNLNTTGNLTAGLGAGGSPGTLISFPTTTGKGSLIVAATDNATGSFNTTISNASAVAQSQVITIPDCGATTANFIISSLTGTGTTQHITAGSLEIDAGNFAVNGLLVLYPATPTDGQLIIAATNNTSGNFATSLTNAVAIGQAQTISIPDSGASTANFILSSNAAGTQNISGALTLSSVAVATTANNTFTPAMEFGGGNTGITYSNQTGWYSHVGATVTFSLQVSLTSKGSSTGTATIINLPVAGRAGIAIQNLVLTVNGPTWTGQLVCSIAGATTYITLYADASITGGAPLDNTNFSGTDDIYISGTYLV